jgi:hypothetical protein
MDFNNFGPRFGFAYSINKKTVIRGGYGLFFSAQAYNTSFDGSIATFDAATTHVGTTDGGATVNWTLSQPFQAGLRKAEGNTKGLGARYGDTLTVFNQHRVNPYNQQWQLSIQRELPGKTVIEVAYVGMLTVKQLESYNLNELPDSYLSRKGEQSERETNPFLKIFDPLSVLGQGTQITKRQLWLPYPQYTTFTMDGLNTGTATYHAFQSRVEKRYNQGLSLHANYSFSKLMDNNRSSVVNIRDWASVSLYDRSHILRMAFVYEMPFGPGKSLASSAPAIIKHLIGGWGISGFLDVVSGAPLSVTHTNGRPYTLRNPSKSGPVKRRLGDVLDAVTNLPSNTYFDTTAFLPLPDQYTITPEPPYLDFLRGPATKTFNLALYKNASFAERLKLEIRADLPPALIS